MSQQLKKGSRQLHKALCAAMGSVVLGAGLIGTSAFAQTGTGPGADSAIGDTMRGDMGRNPTYPDQTEVDVPREGADIEPGEPVTNAAAAGADDGDEMIYESAESASERRNKYQNESEKEPRKSEKAEPQAGTDNAAGDDLSQNSERSWRDTKSAFSDGWLEGKLETALLLNDQLETSEIDVKIVDDRALLQGTVPSEVQKELAERIAVGVDGIKNVDNQLSVAQKNESQQTAAGAASDGRRSFSQYVADVTTTAAVKARLLVNDEVKGTAIDVKTVGDEVTLSGTVQSDAQKQLAEQLARDSDRVKEVRNQLEIAQQS